MRILVTGGAGYIGAHTVKSLVARNYDVVVLDTLEKGHRGMLPVNVELIVGNSADVNLLDNLFNSQKIDAVIHFAGYKAAGESVEQPAKYFRNNVTATQTLLESMVRNEVKYLIFSSSCSVFGNPQNMPVTEDNNPYNPESPYAESKLMVEKMLGWFDRAYGLKSVSLRYFNAAGADPDGTIGEDWSVTLNLIPLVMKAAAGVSASVPVFGTDYPTPDGTGIRDYVHVNDLADAHILALENVQKTNQTTIYNLGTGKGSSVKEIIDTTRLITGREIVADERPRRPGDPMAIWADNSKVRSELGWQPHYGLEEIIRTAWNWHSKHPNGI